RRGRRGRRRRRGPGGGRGFPESKYASDASQTGETPSEEMETDAGEAPLPAPDDADFLVLPGESLAKYRGSSAAEAEDDDITDQVLEAVEGPETADDAADEDLDADIDESAASLEPEVEPEPASLIDQVLVDEIPDAVENPYDEPIHYPPDNAEPDAPLEIAADAAQAQAEALIAAEAGETLAEPSSRVSEDEEDREIQAMILDVDEADGEGEGEQEIPAEGEPQSSQVREQGGRFLRRAPRGRVRRRGRGGPLAAEEARPERTERPPERAERTERPDRPPRALPSITDLLKEGQEILVQIAKEPLGQKGARITSHIALPGRYVVYMPTLEHMGVSRKIGSDEERQRLKRILQSQRGKLAGGFITRTAAEGRSESEIIADMTFLAQHWLDIKSKAEKHPAPILLHHDLDIVSRVLRDQLTETYKAIWVDNEELYESVVRFVERFQPNLVSRVKMYTREVPIFDAFNISNELEKALRPKVWLKSGGYIVINQTEALVAIDVNTGKFVGKSNRLEDTIVKTNTEAIKEIVRQVRLRDLGGIIVIDFIDMDERKNRQKVMQALEEAMRADRAPYKILQFNDFGLVAITRKRVKQSLERTLCAPCPYCDGAGYVKSVQTVIGEILQEAAKMAKLVEGKDVMLRVHPDVAKVLKSHHNRFLEELEETLGRPVLVKGDPAIHHEKYDMA
ncbi:MAG: Rne/Rng family ribonuclease, partial [Bryobacteraceae bacterium]|nr:Rne/Rng family ribonuclease [Bryobacteraceae bacterium]